MKVILVVATTLLCILPLRAQQPGRMTIAQSLDALACLRGLDGYQTIVKVSGSDQIVPKAYEFANGALRWTIARNIDVLKEVENATATARNSMIKEITKGTGEIKPGTPEALEFNAQWENLLKTPNALSDKLGRIKLADLKLDKNEVPSSVLSGCRPIVDE